MSETPETTGTVLVVEDDAAVRAVTSRALTRFGYSVLTASSGEEALELAREHGDSIDLLLTDVMMPGMNGVELARRVVEVCPDIRVFFMSGYADRELVGKGLLDPATHFLQKPFSPHELGGRVKEILAG